MRRGDSRSGQIALLLVWMLLAGILLFMVTMDVFLFVRGKNRLQNAGDAAALAAADWQGATLNLIGELNVAHLAAACETNVTAMAGICALQERLLFAGPMVGFLAANELARENGAPVRSELTRLVNESASLSREYLPDTPTWPGKADDYVSMIDAVVADGICAGADNAAYVNFDFAGNDARFIKEVYENLESKNWRWFCVSYFGGNHNAARAGLADIFKPAENPEGILRASAANSEYFGLGLRAARGEMRNNAVPRLVDLAAEYGLDDIVTEQAIVTNGVLKDVRFPWYVYDERIWREWTELDLGGESAFPLAAPVRDEYNVSGAMAACRVENELTPFSATSQTNTFVWTAAARPFGRLSTGEGSRVNEFLPDGNPALVVPAFDRTRLIPLGGVGYANLNMADSEWLRHIRDHVIGGAFDTSCRYCKILAAAPGLLAEGVSVLGNNQHDDYCVVDTPPGSGPTGGTSHAH